MPRGTAASPYVPIICFLLFTISFTVYIFSYMRSLPNVLDEYKAYQLSQSCNSTSINVCDPNNILQDVQREDISNHLLVLEDRYGLIYGHDNNGVDPKQKQEVKKLKTFVVVIEKMEEEDGIPFFINEEKCNYIAERLRNSLDLVDDQVNYNEKIVILFSREERSLCISCTPKLEHVLTPGRIDELVDRMDEKNWWWDNNDLYQGILYCIDQLSEYLEEGSPSFVDNYGWYFIIIVYLGNWYRERQRQRTPNYIQERIHYRELNEEEQTEATSLMNKYQCYSCPICLEDFTTSNNTNHHGNVNMNNNNITHESYTEEKTFLGSDNVQIQLLRCGHSTCQQCWDEWISVGKNLRLCPVCKRDIGG